MDLSKKLTTFLNNFDTPPIVCGLMSGSSVDGLDGVVVRFLSEKNHIRAEILTCFAEIYTKSRIRDLKNTSALSGFELINAHTEFSTFLSGVVQNQLIKKNIIPNLLCLHGHTVFHQPDLGFSMQLGCGATLHALTGIAVVSNFRQADVALKGQGAPLVPVAEQLLWPNRHAFLNIGGIANISLHHLGHIEAFDVCPANQLLNHLSRLAGKHYDDAGQIARSGRVNRDLLHRLNGLHFYNQPGPRSLGTEHIQAHWMPLLNQSIELSVTDKLATATHHIAGQVVGCLNQLINSHDLPRPIKVMATGGGAFNTYLIEIMNQLGAGNIIFELPSTETIEYKEAISFALLGLLRVAGLPNCSVQVTGAQKPALGGALHGTFALS